MQQSVENRVVIVSDGSCWARALSAEEEVQGTTLFLSWADIRAREEQPTPTWPRGRVRDSGGV
jgi:hypothetical protein